MAIPILHFWEKYFDNHDEGLGSTYERFIINDILQKVVENFRIKSVLEVPAFGFTGLSGINSMQLALDGLKVDIVDNYQERLKMINRIWEQVYSETVNKVIDTDFIFVNDFEHLPFHDKSYDMSWNFSALWFVNDIELFLSELSRITKKLILIMVPNRTGLGYLHQKYTGKDDLKKFLNEDFIKSSRFIPLLERNGWQLLHDNYLDCPLWPDIGMSKEDFFSKLFPCVSFKKKKHKSKDIVSILDYYTNKLPDLKDKLYRYRFFEDYAPNCFKKIWAHHHYYLFTKDHNNKDLN